MYVAHLSEHLDTLDKKKLFANVKTLFKTELITIDIFKKGRKEESKEFDLFRLLHLLFFDLNVKRNIWIFFNRLRKWRRLSISLYFFM